MVENNFPKDFKFGWSQAGFQSEMGDNNALDDKSDWYVWVHDKENMQSGLVSGDMPENGPGYWNNYKSFHEAAQNMGLKMARIGVEWSRLFPDPFPEKIMSDAENNSLEINNNILSELDKYVNKNALNHYIEIFTDIKNRNIDLIINMYHWPLPIWLSDPVSVRKGIKTERSGWLNDRIVQLFALFSSYITYKMEDLAVAFSTMNEPNVVYGNGFINIKSGFPPSYLSSEFASKIKNNILKAHALSYDSMKKITKKPVGIIYANTYFTPLDPEKDNDVIIKADNDAKWSFFDPLIKGDKSLGINGNKLDWIGINYYTRTMLKKNGDGYNSLKGYGHSCSPNTVTDDKRPTSDIGWEFYPEGLEHVIMNYWNRYKLPMCVTENGMADNGDYQRPYYLVSHIASVLRAINKGANVKGYLHWSLVDNYEWASGFDPKFGLIGYDKNKKLYWRSSALVYKEIATKNCIPAEFKHLDSIPPINGLKR